MKTDYSNIVPKVSPWYYQAYDFLLDWLKEIKAYKRKTPSKK